MSIFESSECLYGQPVSRSCICPLLFVLAWYVMFNALEDYILDYNDYNVPYNWPKSELLRPWIDEQRALYKCGKLSQTRIDLLEEVGLPLRFYK